MLKIITFGLGRGVGVLSLIFTPTISSCDPLNAAGMVQGNADMKNIGSPGPLGLLVQFINSYSNTATLASKQL